MRTPPKGVWLSALSMAVVVGVIYGLILKDTNRLPSWLASDGIERAAWMPPHPNIGPAVPAAAQGWGPATDADRDCDSCQTNAKKAAGSQGNLIAMSLAAASVGSMASLATEDYFNCLGLAYGNYTGGQFTGIEIFWTLGGNNTEAPLLTSTWSIPCISYSPGSIACKWCYRWIITPWNELTNDWDLTRQLTYTATSGAQCNTLNNNINFVFLPNTGLFWPNEKINFQLFVKEQSSTADGSCEDFLNGGNADIWLTRTINP